MYVLRTSSCLNVDLQLARRSARARDRESLSQKSSPLFHGMPLSLGGGGPLKVIQLVTATQWASCLFCTSESISIAYE